MSGDPTRRDWLKTIAAGSVVVSGSGVAVASDEAGEQNADTTVSGGEQRRIDGVVLESVDGDDRFVFGSLADVDWEAIPDGEYDVKRYESGPSGSVVRQRRQSVHSGVTIDSSHLKPTVLTGGQTHQQTFVSGSTIPVYVGVIDTDGIVNKPASESVDVDITVNDPDNNTVADVTQTVDNGALRWEYDSANDASTGRYTVNVSRGNDSAATSFSIGRKLEVSQLADNAYPNETFTAGIDVTENGDPADGVDIDVNVTHPDDSTETKTATVENGIATISVTPSGTGRMSISAGTDTDSIDISEYIAIVPDFDLRNQLAGDQAEVFGHVQTASGPATNEEFDFVVTDASNQTILDTTVTTDGDGFYSASWDTPADEEKSYTYKLNTTGDSGTTIVREDVITQIPDDGGGSDDPQLSVSYDLDEITPGDQATLTVSLEDDAGDPVTGQDVELAVHYGFSTNSIPIEHTTVTTDSNGEATHSFTLPSDAPDGASLRAKAGTTLNGVELTATGYGDVQRYETGFNRPDSPQAGQTFDFTVTSTKPPFDNDEPVPNESYRVYTGTDDYLHTLYGTASVVTDSNGEASVSADIDADAQNRLGINIINDYWNSGFQWVPTVNRFDSTINGVPDPAQAGDTLDVSVTDSGGNERKAAVLLEDFSIDSISFDFAEPGSPAQITIPEEAAGKSPSITVYAPEGGKIHRGRVSFEVAEATSAAFTVSPSEPMTGDTVTFDGSSSSSAAGSLSYEWDLTGDGSTDKTGEVVETSYDSTGDYTVALTVTDEDGTTDETTQTVTVKQDPVDEYRNDNGEVTTDGLRTAVSDWRNGDAGVDVLEQVIEEWSN